MIERPKACVKF